MQALYDAHERGIEILRRFSDVRWTYVTPAYKFAPFGIYTGKYYVMGDEFTPGKDDNRNDYISYADYAKGMIDIIERHQYIRERRMALFPRRSSGCVWRRIMPSSQETWCLSRPKCPALSRMCWQRKPNSSTKANSS